eukprot:2348171-Ditylum_brightwellii.AAC.1
MTPITGDMFNTAPTPGRTLTLNFVLTERGILFGAFGIDDGGDARGEAVRCGGVGNGRAMGPEWILEPLNDVSLLHQDTLAKAMNFQKMIF